MLIIIFLFFDDTWYLDWNNDHSLATTKNNDACPSSKENMRADDQRSKTRTTDEDNNVKM